MFICFLTYKSSLEFAGKCVYVFSTLLFLLEIMYVIYFLFPRRRMVLVITHKFHPGFMLSPTVEEWPKETNKIGYSGVY